MLGDGGLSATRGLCAASLLLAAACAGDAPSPRAADTAGAGAGAGASASLNARRAQRCDARDASLVVDSAGVGPVLIGERVGALAERCAVADTSFALEGMQERAHVVTVREYPVTILSTGTADTSVIRAITSHPAFRTSGGVGVGSSVESLRSAHGRLCAAQGEGNFVVLASGLPGVSFAIDWSPPPSRDPAVAETPFPGGDPGTALDQARITRLWVHGVSGGCRVGVARRPSSAERRPA